MTRKDYEVLAAALKGTRPESPMLRRQWAADVRSIGFALQQDNPSFNLSRFEAAAGYLEVDKR